MPFIFLFHLLFNSKPKIQLMSRCPHACSPTEYPHHPFRVILHNLRYGNKDLPIITTKNPTVMAFSSSGLWFPPRLFTAVWTRAGWGSYERCSDPASSYSCSSSYQMSFISSLFLAQIWAYPSLVALKVPPLWWKDLV